MKNSMGLFFLTFVFLTGLLSGCTPTSPPVPSTTVPPTFTSLPPTNTPIPTATKKPISTSTPTSIPCPYSETPFKIDNINVYFEDGVKPSDCNRFISFISMTNEWAKSIKESITADIYIYKNAQSVGSADFTWGRTVKCNNYSDVDSVIKAWETGRGGIAYSPFKEYPSRVFFTVEWEKSYLPEFSRNIVHEIIHTIQYQYYGGRNACAGTLPSWWTEGQAQYYAETVILDWGIQPDGIDLSPCYEIHLVNLPTQTNSCVYMMGSRSLVLLSNKYGDKSFEVWKEFAKGKSFEDAFYSIYGINVSDLSKLMDSFLECLKTNTETFCYSAVAKSTP